VTIHQMALSIEQHVHKVSAQYCLEETESK